MPPYLLTTDDNLDGGLSDEDVDGMIAGIRADRTGFLDQFSVGFFSAGGELKVTDQQRRDAFALAVPARDEAVTDCVDAFGRTDFRSDLAAIDVPVLVLHGDSDAIVPLEVSGARFADLIDDATLHVVTGAPHGFNLSHADEFNTALLAFLDR